MLPVFMWQTLGISRKQTIPWQHADLSSLPTENGERVYKIFAEDPATALNYPNKQNL